MKNMLLQSIIHMILVSTSVAQIKTAQIVTAKAEGHHEFTYSAGKYSNESSFELVSSATFEDTINTTGWSTLVIDTTANELPDYWKAYWSGYLETNLTYALTEAHLHNSFSEICQKPLKPACQQLQTFLSNNIRATAENAHKQAADDPFWYQVYLQLWQIKGISDAYKKAFISSSSLLTYEHLLTLADEVMGIYLIQIHGDLYELITAFNATQEPSEIKSYEKLLLNRPSCSALIKVVQNDTFISHVTWNEYAMMLRVLKQYNFPWKVTNQPGASLVNRQASFSSYPSVISSMDDFYLLKSGLVVLETTIGNYNPSLWQYIREAANTSVMEPYRVVAANRLATNGEQWADYFSRHNSGTYNNQWMVFDSNRFTPGQEITQSGILTVIEQLPNMVVKDDVTPVLKKQSYWASYNIPYFPQIYNMSGFADMANKYGDVCSYNLTPRAQIFRREHVTVTNLTQMYNIMRYNRFKSDPLSKCNCTPPYNANFAISARGDLNDPKGVYPSGYSGYGLYGGTDVKIVDMQMLQTMNFMAANGPTFSDQPAFQWSLLPVPVTKPELHPDKWMFDPITTDFDKLRKLGQDG